MASPQPASGRILRIIDVNFNRASEGLRFLEEIARFILDDAGLNERLKTLRHEIIRGDASFNEKLLQTRDSSSDVGMDIQAAGEEKGKDLPILLVANARRVQESLRTLEELAKLPENPGGLDSAKLMHSRFSLYTLEQDLMFRLARQERRRLITGLYVVLDTDALKGRSHLEVAEQVIRGGAHILQLRDKIRSKKEIIPVARRLQTLCTENRVLFIMNDYLDVALDCDADGLHLGQDDLPFSSARKLLPPGKILGCTVATVEQALAAQAEGADYIAPEAIYPTTSKTSSIPPKPVGLEMLRKIKQAVNVPVVAIGGITLHTVSEVIGAGADSIAVINAVLGARSPEMAAREMVEAIKKAKLPLK
jgi:thiamine-phosphate pyrophosphorylase